jgi:hypothetical protein
VWWYIPIIPVTREAEKGGSQFEVNPGKKVVRSYFRNKPGMVAQTCNTSNSGGRGEAKLAQAKA